MKVILITGSTDGIGKLAARRMAQEGHHLYLHGRDANKLDSVIEELKQETGNNNIDGFVADFSDLSQVKTMSDQINQQVPTIDVLVNNAGIFKSSQQLANNGIDIRMVVNYFAPYLLTNQILDKLRSTDASRIINLSSAAQSTVSLDLLEGNIQVSDQEAYAQSKLAILMLSLYWSRQEPDISVTALNPGSLLNTNMVKEAYGRFWSSADKGANIIYDLSFAEDYNGNDGKYFDNDRGSFGPAHPDAYDDTLVTALIEKTTEVICRLDQDNLL